MINTNVFFDFTDSGLGNDCGKCCFSFFLILEDFCRCLTDFFKLYLLLWDIQEGAMYRRNPEVWRGE